MDHSTLANKNKAAWEADAYAAWVRRYGAPADQAAILAADPAKKLRRLLNHMPNPQGLNIANPLGSHGRVATALALLGAQVTVFDISESNAQYATQLAAAAGVEVNYVVGEFQSTANNHSHEFNIVVMELGVLHYFLDIAQFVAAVYKLVCTDGIVVLNEFHPLQKKSLDLSSDNVKFTGDYFFSKPELARTPYDQDSDLEIPACLIRRWNLGEIVSAFATGGFHIQALVEHPASEFPELPGTFTLVAKAS